jgi:hypothetical protein
LTRNTIRQLCSFVAAVVLALVSLSGSASANLVTNGDFDGSLAGWPASGNVALVFATNLEAPGDAGTPYFVDFGCCDGPDDGVLSQTFATMPGATYEVTFRYGAYGTHGAPNQYPNQSIQVVAGDLDQTITTGTPTMNLSSLFVSYDYTFTATSDSTALIFSDVSGGTIQTDGMLANVDVENVPEPASLTVLGVGFLGLLIARRGGTIWSRAGSPPRPF